MNTAPTESSNRFIGLDALRIVSMFTIVLAHVINLGGILDAAQPHPQTYAILSMLMAPCSFAVNAFVLMSGFLLIRKPFSPGRLTTLLAQALFLFILIDLVCATFTPNYHYLCFQGRLWFWRAYVGLVLLSPILNAGAEHLINTSDHSIRPILPIVILALFMWRPVPIILGGNLPGSNYGHSVLWFCALYLFGAWIRIRGLHNSSHWLVRHSGSLAASAIFVSWAGYTLAFLRWNHPGSTLFAMTSPIVWVGSIFMFIAFCRIRGTRFTPTIIRIIQRLSALTFGVYLVHGYPLNGTWILLNRLGSWAEMDIPRLLVCILGTTMGLYITSSALDGLRLWVFRKTRIRENFDHMYSRLAQWLEP